MLVLTRGRKRRRLLSLRVDDYRLLMNFGITKPQQVILLPPTSIIGSPFSIITRLRGRIISWHITDMDTPLVIVGGKEILQKEILSVVRLELRTGRVLGNMPFGSAQTRRWFRVWVRETLCLSQKQAPPRPSPSCRWKSSERTRRVVR